MKTSSLLMTIGLCLSVWSASSVANNFGNSFCGPAGQGVKSNCNLVEEKNHTKLWGGMMQNTISIELVSTEGLGSFYALSGSDLNISLANNTGHPADLDTTLLPSSSSSSSSSEEDSQEKGTTLVVNGEKKKLGPCCDDLDCSDGSPHHVDCSAYGCGAPCPADPSLPGAPQLIVPVLGEEGDTCKTRVKYGDACVCACYCVCVYPSGHVLWLENRPELKINLSLP
eukprot:gb/GEZN01018256.1/.p1 GENE.gb/GEZN01018256.1/~~gb/GEZN01018256.1/.p1  ORF type:complete len:226 (-),score=29.23 gb/GEZN01018256.1/:51-728(-)